jgi:hypothetical protein
LIARHGLECGGVAADMHAGVLGRQIGDRQEGTKNKQSTGVCCFAAEKC